MAYYWFICDPEMAEYYVEETATPIAPVVGALQIEKQDYDKYSNQKEYLVADPLGNPKLNFNNPVSVEYCHWDFYSQQWVQDEEEKALMLADIKKDILNDVKLYAAIDFDKQARNECMVCEFESVRIMRRDQMVDAKRLLAGETIADDCSLMVYCKRTNQDPKEYAKDLTKDLSIMIGTAYALLYFLDWVQKDLDANFNDPTDYNLINQYKDKYRAFTAAKIHDLYNQHLQELEQEEQKQQQAKAKKAKEEKAKEEKEQAKAPSKAKAKKES